MPNWNELCPDLLYKIAKFSSNAEGMRGVSKTWRTGLENIATELTITGSPLPLNLASRFHCLASLDLFGCTERLNAVDLEALQRLPLTKLALALDWDDQDDVTLAALRDLSLVRLELMIPSLETQFFTDARLLALKGLPLAFLHLKGANISPSGLAAFQGMPLEGLILPELGTEEGLDVILRDMPLASLELAENHGLGDSFLKMLRGLPLTDLNLGDTNTFTDVGLACLQGMALTQFDMGTAVEKKFTDTGIQVFRGMPLEKSVSESM